MRSFNLLIIFLIFTNTIYAQHREIVGYRTEEKINIDGILDEESWSRAECSGDFVTYKPYEGREPFKQTQVCVLYDDRALYIGAKLFDDEPDKILKELTMRDEDNGNTDMFILQLNPFNDKRNVYVFKVTAANVQTDILISDGNYDYNWNAVWMSAVNINENGWTVEISIPYSSIRFPNLPEQAWSVNFWRIIRRTREQSCWNLVKQELGADIEQMGQIIGLKDINPPLRLAFYPYVSMSVDFRSDNKPNYGLNGGLDMKLGITQSHTLDLTLVPDFSHVKSDEEELNLSPFETYYSENRPFFTEGVELFEKVGLFYSRRIGKIPAKYYKIRELQDSGYKIIDNPRYSKLINAIKLSGRNDKNLAIGVFNATTANTWAQVKDSLGNIEKILTEPWANYNMIVLDKSFWQNSYVNVTNAFVIRPDIKYYSNVLGTAYKLMEPTNRFGWYGKGAWSTIKNSQDSEDGFMFFTGIGKLNGKWKYVYELNLLSDKYNPNDFGYLQQNNLQTHHLGLWYNRYQPFGKFNRMSVDVDFYHYRLFKTNDLVQTKLNLFSYLETKKYLSSWINFDISLSDEYDYYEARTPGRVYVRPAIHSFYINISSDYRKTFALDLQLGTYLDFIKRWGYYGNVRPRVRVSDKITIVYGFNFDFDHNDCGFVPDTLFSDQIVFGQRNVNTFINSLEGKWVLNNKMYFNLSIRHYWRAVDYNEFYFLNIDGSLSPINVYQQYHDINFNTFYVDLSFSWNIAPGSYLDLMWKNQIYSSAIIPDYLPFPTFGKNFSNLFNNPQTNTISFRLIYYLDWQMIKRKAR
jgi:hypothetical protein